MTAQSVGELCQRHTSAIYHISCCCSGPDSAVRTPCFAPLPLIACIENLTKTGLQVCLRLVYCNDHLLRWQKQRMSQLCSEYDNRGRLVFRGPRLKMGVCEGVPRTIMPDHLGRYDSHIGSDPCGLLSLRSKTQRGLAV
eukprot:GHUV01058372.1.p1 GENE.GHUV01058372.1~~GHUV01058372.1.p1  ORF type:complete len:139 (-),score=7.02 GHUV01058372.1:15-431(-)